MGAKDHELRLEESSQSKGLGGEEDQKQQLKRKEDQNRRQRACRERKRRARQLLREAHQQQQQQLPHRGGQDEEQPQQQQALVQVASTQPEEGTKTSSSSSVAVVVKLEKGPGEKLHIECSGPQPPRQVDPIAQKSYAQRKKEDQNRRQRECRERKRRSQELENREKQKRAQQELLSELRKGIREPHLGGGTTKLRGHQHHHHPQPNAVQQVVEDESTSMERSASERAKELAPILHELTAGNGVEYQKLTLAKLLQQPLLQPVLPTFVSELDKGVRHAH